MPSRRALLGAVLALGAVPARAEAPMQVHAAMAFNAALDAVLRRFNADGGAAVGVYGPTPVLVRQLAEGAPADLLLTADPTWMDDAAGRGLIRPATRVDLLGNDLVLAGPAGAPEAGTLTAAFPLLDRLGGGRLAMCDPDRDPAGRFPADSHAPIVYPAAVTRRCTDPRAAAVLRFLRSAPATAIFAGFGYRTLSATAG